MRKFLFLLVVSIFSAVSCGEKKSETSGLIDNVSQQLIDEEAALNKNIGDVGLVYQANYQTYGSKAFFEACDENQVAALKTGEKKLSEIEKNLTPDSDRFRNNALDFYRKVQFSKESLHSINSLTQPYCEQDQKAVNKCIGTKSPILFHINIHIATHMIVHPILVPNSDRKTGLYLLTRDNEDEDYIRSYDLKDGSDKKHYSEILPEVSTVAHLEELFKCLSDSNLKSDIGQKIVATARVSFQLGRRDCLLIKGDILAAQKKANEEKTNITFPVSAIERSFCGTLLN